MISPKLSLDFSAATSPIAGMGDAARSALVNPAPAVRLASAAARALRTNARRLGGSGHRFGRHRCEDAGGAE